MINLVIERSFYDDQATLETDGPTMEKDRKTIAKAQVWQERRSTLGGQS
jgi:hypothetical protein